MPTLKGARTQRKVTQRALAEAIGVCVASISAWEGGHLPRPKLRVLIEDFLCAPVDWLVRSRTKADRIAEAAMTEAIMRYLARRTPQARLRRMKRLIEVLSFLSRMDRQRRQADGT